MSDHVTVWAFASVKGGVGKSTLAALTALQRARAGGRVLVLEADFLGTSMSDGLPLCAPQLAMRTDLPGGILELTNRAPPRWLTLDETQVARRARETPGRQWRPVGVPFLNDALLHEPATPDAECWLPSMAWRMEGRATIDWLPASPHRNDTLVAAGWLHRSDQTPWVRRLTWLLDLLPLQLPDLTDVVIDLPPGMFGFTDSVLSSLHAVKEAHTTASWNIRSFLVTSPDLNDLTAAARAWMAFSRTIPGWTPLMNRASEVEHRHAVDVIRQRLPQAESLGFVGRLIRMGYDSEVLGRLFRGGSAGIDDGRLPEFVSRLPTSGGE